VGTLVLLGEGLFISSTPIPLNCLRSRIFPFPHTPAGIPGGRRGNIDGNHPEKFRQI